MGPTGTPPGKQRRRAQGTSWGSFLMMAQEGEQEIYGSPPASALGWPLEEPLASPQGLLPPTRTSPPAPSLSSLAGGPRGLSVRGDGGDLQCRRPGFEAFRSPLPNPAHPSSFFLSSDVSPASSSSGTLIQYTPDSATSPTAERPSPHPSFQKVKEEGEGVVKKAKSRTAFSQEQLQILHQRFQSQKYLSPQQIRELAAALGLTYKQVKTWFQNQRMKFKRCQKESQWVEKGVYLPQNGFHQAAYLDITPTFHQGFPVGASRNLQAVTNVHQAYSSGQTYGNGQSLYSFMAVEDEGLFGKGGTSCNTQQTMGLLSQQMNFYHGYPADMDYVSLESEDTYGFQSTSDSVAPFSSSPVRHQYQAPWHPLGSQSGYES
ncbi:homeobox protein NANOG [Egretta garzetta]|nr:homeobox protein NANOG [Egretta garzetta]